MLIVTAKIMIHENEFEFSAARSSGPGGQNVNKVNSKVVLRWRVLESPCLPLEVKARFFSKFGNRINSEGALIIASEEFRDQVRNRQACLNKLKAMLLEVASPPKTRKKSRPTRSSVERRKQGKRIQGEKKRQRGRIKGED